MTVTNAVIQGIVQGLTEFLPVSSSGHLSLFQYFTGQSGDSGMSFSVFLHMGTLLAVLLAFYKTIISLAVECFGIVRDLIKTKFAFKEVFNGLNPQRRMVLLLVASLVPMLLSFPLMKYFDSVASDNDIIIEGCCFMITSILLFLGDNCLRGNKTAADMKYRDAAVVGLAQAIAPFPGISRSGSTISVGLLTGLDREFAVAFSFIMGIPPILAANIMEFSNISPEAPEIPASMILIGMAVSLVVGILAIQMVKWLVKSEQFKVFAWYTLVLGVLVIGIGIFERLTDHMIQDLVMSLISYLPAA